MRKRLSFFYKVRCVRTVTLSLAAVLVLLALLPALSGCGTEDNAPADTTSVRVGVMTGPTGIGLVQMMDDAANGETGDTFIVKTTADQLAPLLLQGELDVAAVPANLASILYKNSNGSIRAVAVNTLGVLSVVERGETVTGLADLAGKTICATGRGTVPEYTLRYLLRESGIDPDRDVTLLWKSEPAEVLAYLKSEDGAGAVAMLPQPYLTAALSQIADLRVAVSLNDAWDAMENGSRCVTGVLVVRAAFADEHPEVLRRFLDDAAASIAAVTENPAAAGALCASYLSMNEGIATRAIPECNLTYLEGDAMKSAVTGYLQVLYEENPAAVGGAMPDDGFCLTVPRP